MGLDITASAGDVIIIDSENFVITKNWINIKWNKIAWSIYPICEGTNSFTVYDVSGGLSSSWFSVLIKLKDVIL
jgi:hypothetical protein